MSLSLTPDTVDVRPVFEKYVYAGCKCQHTKDISRKQSELKEIQSTYRQLYKYLREAESEADNAFNDLKVENSSLRAIVASHAQQKRQYEVITPTEKQRFRYHGVATLGAEIARRSAISRLEKQRKRTHAMTIETAQKIKVQEEVVAKAGNRYLNAKTLADWIKTVLQLADIHMLSVNSISIQEETWGTRTWGELRDAGISKVASKWLKGLIYELCNGYKWETTKESLVQ